MKHRTRLRARREELGLTQYTLAKAVRKSQSYLAKIETGQIANPGVSIALALASALGATVEDLFSSTCRQTPTA